ncbi:MAG: prenyltransferase, partial [Planctomicrobium sp.]|nr:prenyltransferase [Planctomicrobium sp.]
MLNNLFRRFSLCFVMILSTLSTQDVVAQDVVDREVDASVARALEFLAKQQTDHGSWRTESWGDSTAISSLAVMSFLAAGHTPG